MSMMLALLLAGQAAPAAVVAGPPHNAAHPARNEQLLIPSHGSGMNVRIVLGGLSTGAFAAVLHARTDPQLAGLKLLDAGNIGKLGADARARKAPKATVAKRFNDLGNILTGANADSLADAFLAPPPAWDLRADAAALTATPLLAIGASEALGADTAEIADAVRAAGNTHVTAQAMTTDHSFADHRIALAGAIVDWLATLGK